MSEVCIGLQKFAADKPVGVVGIALAIGLLTVSQSSARPVSEELSLLFDNHPQYQEAQNNLEAAEALLDNAFAAFLPQASITAGKGFEVIDSPARRATASSSSQLSNENATLTVTMPLFTGYANEANFDTARRDVEIARSTLGLTAQTLALGGVSSYILVKRSADAVALADESVRAIQQQVDAQQALIDTGAGIQLDVLLAQSALQDVKAARASLKSELSAAIAQYTQFFGHAPEIASMEKIEAPQSALPETVERAQEIAVASHPTISIAQFQIDRATDQVRAARSTLFPQISVTGTANHESNVSGTRGTQNNIAILVQGTWQIFDGFGTAARTSAAQSQASAAKDRNRFAHRQIVQDTEIAWGQFQAASETLSLFEEAAMLAQQVVNAQSELVETGRETEIVLLQAQTAALDRERALIIAESDRSLASIQLLFTMGQLSRDLFEASASVLDDTPLTPPLPLDEGEDKTETVEFEGVVEVEVEVEVEIEVELEDTPSEPDASQPLMQQPLIAERQETGEFTDLNQPLLPVTGEPLTSPTTQSGENVDISANAITTADEPGSKKLETVIPETPETVEQIVVDPFFGEPFDRTTANPIDE